MNETYDNIDLPALGSERANNTYLINSMHNANVNITVGSDCPTSEPKPIMAIYNGMTRLDGNGEQLSSVNEYLSLEQILYAASINGAYANFL